MQGTNFETLKMIISRLLLFSGLELKREQKTCLFVV